MNIRDKKSEIEYKANEMRLKNGYSISEPIDLNHLLNVLGVIAIFKPLKSNICGIAAKLKKNYLLINTSNTLGRQNFTIAHELYHLFIQDEFSSKVDDEVGIYNRYDINEFLADIFATALLMPLDGIYRMIPDEEKEKDKVTIFTLMTIEQSFKCSRQALLYRLIEMDLISKNLCENYSTDVIANAEIHNLDVSLYKPTYKNYIIGDYTSRARKLYENEKISESKYLMLIGVINSENDLIARNEKI